MAGVTSREQADEHIQEIRRRKGADNPEGLESDNTRDLDRALNLLSNQLYEKETHFLLELIQNSDDNTFDEDIPSVAFKCVRNGAGWSIRIICNEVGFKRENVEALCRIGDSTKRVDDRTRGFIGEKGIGFKSVFKVANIVRIHSGAYSFMLDRRTRLGMITPSVDGSAWQLRRRGKSGTHILLELRGSSEFRLINDELEKLEPEILIFLRKISKLSIDIPDRELQFEVTRIAEDQALDGQETAELTRTNLLIGVRTSTKYVIVRHQETLPQGLDDRRPNIRNSEVVLAFEIDRSSQPLLRARPTFAYLPINDYGFNYLIQGDFLLVANRESVDSSNWNDRILNALFRVFVYKAVPRFNAIRNIGAEITAGLRYTWPLYLQDRGVTNQFWLKLKQRIFRDLPGNEILESRYNGQLCRPGTLSYIEEDFRLNGAPLVEDERSAQRHLSFSYDSKAEFTLPILYDMGLKKMEVHDFVQELTELIARVGTSYLESQSREWHSKLADVLQLRLFNSSVLSDLPLIPLRDGRWVPLSHRHVFLEEDSADSAIPGGLDIHLVQSQACQDPRRKAFFEWLGIRACDRGEICRMILERYSGPIRPTLVNAVDDAFYLFKTPRSVQIAPVRRLLLVGAPPYFSFKSGSAIYVEEPNQTSIISRYANNPESSIPLLHPMYIRKARELSQEPEFISWICSSVGVSTKPRLVDVHLRLTPEFNFLKANASKDLLILLRDNWGFYAPQLQRSESALNVALKEMNVVCIDGRLRPLRKTILPRQSLKVAAPNLPFVDIPDPENTHWNHLAIFGVLTRENTTLYQRELKALAVLPVNNMRTRPAVEAVYAGLQSSLSGPNNQIREDFRTLRLIFVNNNWVLWSKCVWNGEGLSSFHNINSEYPQYRRLFRNYLALGNVNGSHVVTELQYMNSLVSNERLNELVILLNKYLAVEIPSGLMTNLRGAKIFPVKTRDFIIDRRSYDEHNWYIADRQGLWDSFNGKLPLLDLDVKSVRALQPLIEALEMGPWQLSVADEPKLEMVGTPIYDDEKTQDLRQRAIHFSQLITESSPGYLAQLQHRLANLRIWRVSEIKLLHEVHGVLGVEESGSVIFDEAGDDIYISIHGSVRAVIENQLAEKFIRFCDIPENRHIMVGPILNYPLENLRHFLDEHGLDISIDPPHFPSNDSQVDTEFDEDIEPSHPYNDIQDLISRPRTPNSNQGTAFLPLATEDLGQPSLLRQRIPELDESISIVRRAAALPSTAPTLIVTPSRMQASQSNAGLGSNINANNALSPISRNERASPRHRTSNPRESSIPYAEERSEVVGGAFDMADLQATFSDIVSTDTPSRTSLRESTEVLSSSSPSRTLRTLRSNIVPNSENSMLALRNQHIGLLGETFINDWISRELSNDWDPTRHWTSRNRNTVYPESPFRGNEGDYADFTYADTHGEFTRLLARHGFIHNVAPWFSSPPTYHLEVKSTTGSCLDPFFMSNNQVEKAQSFSFDENTIPENVYVVIRVYNLDRPMTPGFTVYLDPWAMYMKSELRLQAQGGYFVTL
ncbi:hypothetical protein V8E51_012949 [Hyaloscypha variabilis]